MNRRALLLSLLACLSSLGFASPINHEVSAHPFHLAQDLAESKELVARLMAHFGCSRPELINLLKSLHPAELPLAGAYFVYVPNENELRGTVVHLEAGTKVFADNAGTPILLADGSPMVKSKSDQSSEEHMAIGALRSSIPDSAMAVEWTSSAVEPRLAGKSSRPANVVQYGGKGSDWSRGAFGLLAIFGSFSHGHAESRGAPVPEPNALLGIGAGLIAFGTIRRRASHSNSSKV